MKKKIFAQTHCSLLHALHRFFVRQLFAMAKLDFLKLANKKETRQHWNVTIVLRAAKEKLQFDQSSAAAKFVHCRAGPLREEQGYMEYPCRPKNFQWIWIGLGDSIFLYRADLTKQVS